MSARPVPGDSQLHQIFQIHASAVDRKKYIINIYRYTLFAIDKIICMANRLLTGLINTQARIQKKKNMKH